MEVSFLGYSLAMPNQQIFDFKDEKSDGEDCACAPFVLKLSGNSLFIGKEMPIKSKKLISNLM